MFLRENVIYCNNVKDWIEAAIKSIHLLYTFN